MQPALNSMLRNQLPTNDPDSEEPYSAAENPARGSVLIIDDDPVFSLLASETLIQAGYTAEIASTAHEALASFEKSRPDLVLLDVDLPGASGFDICTTLRTMSPGIEVPIV